MRRKPLGSLLAFAGLVTGFAPAQDPADAFAAAEQRIAANDWRGALTALTDLGPALTTAADRERLAARLYDVGDGLLAARQPDDALQAFRAALAAWQLVHGDVDHPSIASCRSNVGTCLAALGRLPEAADEFAAAAAMQERVFGDAHPFHARTLHNLAACLRDLGRFDEALTRGEAALEMWLWLDTGTDDDVADLHALVARCLRRLGRTREALPHCEAALAIRQRAVAAADDVRVATALHELAYCLETVGRAGEALARNEEALLMRRRLHGEHDHEDVASSLNNMATCLAKLGRYGDALLRYDEALAVRLRLAAGADTIDVAQGLGNVAGCLTSLGRPAEALPKFEASLAMRRRLYGDRDHHDLIYGEVGVGHCLQALGRTREAVPYFERALASSRRLHGDTPHVDTANALAHLAGSRRELGQLAAALAAYEEVLALQRRRHGDQDHPEIVEALGNVASCRQDVGRDREALALCETALAMAERLHGPAGHPSLAAAANGVATCLVALGRPDDALPHFERALAVLGATFGVADHPRVADALDNLGSCLSQVGRLEAARRQHEAAIAMRQRLFGGADHDEVALGLDRAAASLLALGRADEALPRLELAHAMWQRLHPEGNHPHTALGCNDLAVCFAKLGRHEEALAYSQQALATIRTVHGGGDHPDVVAALAGVGTRLGALRRNVEALVLHEQALAMAQRLHDGGDHPSVAQARSDLGACLQRLGRAAEAMPHLDAALAMWRRLYGDRDRFEALLFLDNVARCRQSLGRDDEARPIYEQELAMGKRLFGDADHPDLALVLGRLGSCLAALGSADEAVAALEASCAMVERLRDRARLGGASRQSLFEELKRRGVFEDLQRLLVRTGRPVDAMHAAERSRGRELQDLLQQQRFDPLDEAEVRARRRGDQAGERAIVALREELEAVELADARLLRDATRLEDTPDEDAARAAWRARATELGARRKRLHDERARLCGDVLDAGRVHSPAEVRATLLAGEALVEFTLTEQTSLVYVLTREHGVEAFELPAAHVAAVRLVPRLLPAVQRGSEPVRGRDPAAAPADAADAVAASRELFASLFPPRVWERLQRCRRVFVAAHRDLHRLPFERLVTDVKDGAPVYWLDAGPPIAYVPSGSALHWLRARSRQASDDATALDLLAVGDPRAAEAEPEVPERGAFVVAVDRDGEGARLGLMGGDVLVAYDGRPLADDRDLRTARTEVEQAVEDGHRTPAAIPIEVWRRGRTLEVAARPGKLGVQIGPGPARRARDAAADPSARVQAVTRSGDLDRLGKLPPLAGARAETEAIETVFADKQAKTKRLLGTEATEPSVFDLAAKAKHLHFACHGIAEEYAGQSLSMLVLSSPALVLPGDDGFLKLSDLFHGWRGRLASCRLVVLSACRTNVGPTLRDEAPQALPIGFLFAGAPAVISSLWAVDDASTKELMVDFYGRLLAGETDKLLAFTAAKKALRAKYPDPFHWAPFLYLGAPE